MPSSSDAARQELCRHIDDLIENALRLTAHQPERVNELVDQVEALLQDVLFQDAPYLSGLAGAALLRALTSMHSMDFAHGFQHTQEALALYTELGDAVGLTRSYYWRGVLNRRTHNLSQALDDFLMAVEQARHVDNYKLYCNALNGLASIYMVFKDHPNAIVILEESIDIARQHQDLMIEAVSMSNAAYQYMEVGDLKRGLEYAQQSAAFFMSHDMAIMAIWSLNVEGDALRELALYDEAEQVLERARQMAIHAQSDAKLSGVYISLGILYQRMGQYERAIENLQQAITLAQGRSDETVVVSAYKNLAECHQALGQHAQAYEHIVRFYELRERSFSVEAESKMKTLQARVHADNAQRLAQAERERADALERLRDQDRQYFQQLDQLRLTLLRFVGHDVKSPLSSILLAVDILRHKLAHPSPLSAEKDVSMIHRQLDLIQRAAQNITHLIDETLVLARLDAGRPLNLAYSDLASGVRNLLNGVTHSADADGIAFQYHAAPVLILLHDSDLLLRAVRAFLRYALRALSAGERLHIALQEEVEEVHLRISSERLLVDPRDIERLMDRVGERVFTPDRGQGLGLYMARRILEVHEGRAWIESDPDIGTSFHMALPLKRPSDD